ncbi:hypothetical protein CRG98_022065 [Punica granatum]|uniref:Uncharacterized protein n=1 Tax=Punica granatum TaxID=22663 RepID=A0A2I0JMT4_PUNGR|nr:hypothetical protein CRG98_022065 [Punica granatum]
MGPTNVHVSRGPRKIVPRQLSIHLLMEKLTVSCARPLLSERLDVMIAEVTKLKATSFILKVRFQTWVVNRAMGIKKHLHALLAIAKPKQGKTPFAYLGVSNMVVTSVLIRDEGREQHAVYYVCKVFLPAEKNYITMEKWGFALVVASRKLHPYFMAHSVVVRTDQPLNTVIKAQTMADFISEAASGGAKPSKARQPVDQSWTLITDGSSTVRATGTDYVLVPPVEDPLKYALLLTFPATNNEAEYEALITGLMIAKGAGVINLYVKCDSQLVVNQVLGECKVKEDRMIKYTE